MPDGCICSWKSKKPCSKQDREREVYSDGGLTSLFYSIPTVRNSGSRQDRHRFRYFLNKALVDNPRRDGF
jgi:hypothetical protein